VSAHPTGAWTTQAAPYLAAAVNTHGLGGAGVLAALAKVPDPRQRRGIRHRIGTILALAVCAVLAGARSFTAIGEWVANASDQVLLLLAVDECPPCESTIRRTLQRLDGDELDSAIGGWALACTQPPVGTRRAVAIDGKTVRGSANGDDVSARHWRSQPVEAIALVKRALRSVRGRPSTQELAQKSQRALELTVAALRALFTTRLDLLNECKDGDDRSNRLLMGG